MSGGMRFTLWLRGRSMLRPLYLLFLFHVKYHEFPHDVVHVYCIAYMVFISFCIPVRVVYIVCMVASFFWTELITCCIVPSFFCIVVSMWALIASMIEESIKRKVVLVVAWLQVETIYSMVLGNNLLGPHGGRQMFLPDLDTTCSEVDVPSWWRKSNFL